MYLPIIGKLQDENFYKQWLIGLSQFVSCLLIIFCRCLHKILEKGLFCRSLHAAITPMTNMAICMVIAKVLEVG